MSKIRYPLELKIEVIKYYLSNQGGQKKAAKKFGISRITIRSWVRIFQQYGLEGIEQGRRQGNEIIYYPEKYKRNILEYKKQHNLSNEEVAKKFNISSSNLISIWEEIHDVQQIKYLSLTHENSSQDMLKTKSDLNQSHTNNSELSEEIAYLRAENAYLKKLQALIQERRIFALKRKYK